MIEFHKNKIMNVLSFVTFDRNLLKLFDENQEKTDCT